MTLALGVGGLVFCALAVPPFLSQYTSSLPVWTWTIAGSFVIGLLLMVSLSWVVTSNALRALNGIAAGSFLIGLITFSPAWYNSSLPLDSPAWLVSLAIIGASAAAVAWGRVAWAYLLLAAVLIAFDQAATYGFSSWSFAFQIAVFDFFFSAVFVALALATKRAGLSLDSAEEAAIREVRRFASTSARSLARARVDALVHDSVLVALLAGASSDSGAEAARHEARRALEQIDAHATPGQNSTSRSGLECAWELQKIATEIAPAATFSYEIDAPIEVPGTALLALAEATVEALKNSIRHAERRMDSISRALHVTAGAYGLEVTILDDGVGFDTTAVPPTRLGIAVSILGRMESEQGGHAIIVSRPGTGTRVTLRWRLK